MDFVDVQIVGYVLALVEIAKKLGAKKEYLEPISVLLGGVLGMAFAHVSGEELIGALIVGLVSGLMATEGYSVVKNVMGAKK